MIHDLGYDSDLKIKYQDCSFAQSLDVTGQTILPGLIDGHTHPVWAGDRVHEFAMKVKHRDSTVNSIELIVLHCIVLTSFVGFLKPLHEMEMNTFQKYLCRLAKKGSCNVCSRDFLQHHVRLMISTADENI